VESAFIVRVVSGPEKGLAWIVDPLYEDADFAMSKYSGTNEARHNSEDLSGRTCDAWAHHSYDDSNGALVFVDIQGMCLWVPSPYVSRFSRAHFGPFRDRHRASPFVLAEQEV
jgi:hypothetical protein